MDVKGQSPPHSSRDSKATESADDKANADETFGNDVMRYGVRLHPQPTSDPLDPLNWGRWRKLLILSIVMWMYFLFSYITTTSVPSFPKTQARLKISYSQANWTIGIPALGLAIGPLFWSSFADIYGRRVILILGTIISLIASIGAATAGSFWGYMAARFFQGLGNSPASTVGLAVINDMFFEHERGHKVGAWVLAMDMGMVMGPLVGGFMDRVSESWVHWLTAIFFGVLLLLQLAFLPETLYPRSQMLKLMPAATTTKTSTSAASVCSDVEQRGYPLADATSVPLQRTGGLPLLLRLPKPIPGLRHPRPWDSATRFLATFRFAAVVVAVVVYNFLWYWWVVSVVTMLPAAYAQYAPHVQGLLVGGLLLGTLVAELFVSGRLSDAIVAKLARKNDGVRVAEMRLWLAYPAALLTAVGLILWGVSIDQRYHWIVGQIAFFLFAAGIQIGNTITSAYIVDCYPLQSMSVIAFYSVALSFASFVNPFFIGPWVAASGYTWTFAAQGIIVFFGAAPILAVLHWFGPSLRAKNGHPSWVNPEYDSL